MMTVKEFEKRAKYQNGYDRIIDNWKIIDIHEIPFPVYEYCETDFYICNGSKVYLLKLKNAKTEKLNLVDDFYLCAEFPITIIDNETIRVAINKFNI